MTPIPFTNIALSLSGGGYRATTFHLGGMSYLNQQTFDGQNLLENVKVISTISGGTLTGVMYAYKLSNGEGFTECFDKLYTLLSKDELVKQALQKLNKPAKWKNKHKSRDVINAFAEVYNDDFYDEATFANLYDGREQHLTDAIFGTTEFTNGIQFRLQHVDDNGRFGNGYLNLPDDVSREIRLADATAASSCFPGGFEPMVMPQDFGNGPGSVVEKAWISKEHKDALYQSTAIMDGGITDNQGIEGVKLTEKRRHKRDGKPFIGTYLVSDASSQTMTPYRVPLFKYSRLKNFITLNLLNILSLGLASLLVACLFSGLPVWGIVASSSVLTIIGIWFFIYFLIRHNTKIALDGAFGENEVPELLKDFKVIRKTPIYILLYLIQFRATSTIKMVSDIFLRRIRRLELNSLYADESWNYRFKSNYIYSLEDEMDSLPPEMQKIITAANEMPTSLWFSETEKKDKVLDDLIACGQFTMCFNLVEYAKRLKKGHCKELVWDKLTTTQQKSIEDRQAAMEQDWNKFIEDPYWLLKVNKQGSRQHT